jgi:hypothetical protein
LAKFAEMGSTIPAEIIRELALLRFLGFLIFGALVVCAGLLLRINDRLNGPPRA